MRRVASHLVVIGEHTLNRGVVEISADCVVSYYTFDDELPMTEWLGGIIELQRDDDGILHAFHCQKLLCE